MIVETVGDLLASETNLICHQVNFEGIMGGGVALAIRNKLLTPEQYRGYITYCVMKNRDALGTILLLPLKGSKDRFVANLFSQNAFTYSGTLTNYAALCDCLYKVEQFARENSYTVAMPGYMGCGIAGGDWNIVKSMIEEVFLDSPPVSVTIYYQR